MYAGGHGASSSEKQLFLLNSEDPKYAFFHLEYKLRFIVEDSLSLARIFAVYDCCRISLRNLKGLANGRGNWNMDEDSIEDDEDTPIKYFHIQSCGPGGIAQADGGFAKKLFDHCIKISKRTPDANFM